MNDREGYEHGSVAEDQADEAEIQALLADVESLHTPSDDVRSQAKAVLKADWQQLVKARRTRRNGRWAALAAGVGALAFMLSVLPMSLEPAWNAELADGAVIVDGNRIGVAGEVSISAQSHWRSVQPSRFVLANGSDLRLAAGTTLTWKNPDRFSLETGAVYLDTHAQASLTVDTAFGTVRDIGTRFLVSLNASPEGAQEADMLEVAVRDGSVELLSNNQRHVANADEEGVQVLRQQAGVVTASREPGAAERWTWIHEVPTGYTDRTISGVLESISRDLGQPLRLIDERLHNRLRVEQVQGDLRNLAPRQALDLVTQSARLTWREEAGVIVIDRSG